MTEKTSKKYRFSKKALYAVLPRRCALCEQVTAPDIGVCKACQKDLPFISGSICHKCGREKEECLCGGFICFYEGIYSPFYYEGALAKSIGGFKFRGKVQNAHYYAQEMAAFLDKFLCVESLDLVTCVPLSKKSRNKRGYNQSSLLARQVAAYLGKACNDKALIKIYETPAQHSLPSLERRGNLIGAFEADKKSDLSGKTVLLCDDIATTGATLNECAKTLLLGGAKKVVCATVAVTKKDIK
ncbi:MAG: ComF family protein [Clostridiales bacterium]|nr:ComF family protein [Clostridiales bacterium]